jgi:hypothetical protein
VVVLVVLLMRMSGCSKVLYIDCWFMTRQSSMLMVLISFNASGVCFLVTSTSRVPRIGSYTIENIGASSPDIKCC